MADILSVSSLNLYVKSILESDNMLFDVAVEGEVSNYKKYPSGHCYFTLKDEKSSIKAVMFSSNTRNLGFKPENGMKVIARGRVSLYERDGAYQIYVTNMFLSGEGSYRIAFERIKNKLEKEGIFNPEHKKKLPPFPFRVGVVTSAKGAAFHDIISVAKRRFPCVEIVLAPCMVQGDMAETSIVNAIAQLDAQDDMDVIIIGRGGGSKEDLWVFNSEAVARAAFACKKPTVSAVGHEIDFSILDFVCDVRAATPTAAAELVLPDMYSVCMHLADIDKTIKTNIINKIDVNKNRLKLIAYSQGFTSVRNSVTLNRNTLNNIHKELKYKIGSKIEDCYRDIKSKTELLENQSPLNNLKKGYALIYKDETHVKDYIFTEGESAKLLTFNQELTCKITEVNPRKG